jgi:hypothetical protein
MTWKSMKTARLALLLGTLGLGCNVGGPAALSSDVFAAFAGDFEGFHDWPHAPAMPAASLPPIPGGDGVDAATPSDAAASDAGVHTLPLTVYWQVPPVPPGSTAFPFRTIIVKETSEPDLTARKIFAMVKRGGGFNPNGARNWEWFELQNTVDSGIVINWRGYGPPSGSSDVYGGNPTICNTCHLIAAADDDVWSSAVQLSNF